MPVSATVQSSRMPGRPGRLRIERDPERDPAARVNLIAFPIVDQDLAEPYGSPVSVGGTAGAIHDSSRPSVRLSGQRVRRVANVIAREKIHRVEVHPPASILERSRMSLMTVRGLGGRLDAACSRCSAVRSVPARGRSCR